MASRCEQMKWNRKKLGLTQREFAELVDLDVTTVIRYEKDETAWLTIRPETEDKILSAFENKNLWPIKRVNEVPTTNYEIIEETVEVEEKPAEVIETPILHKGLTTNDRKTMTLIEFAFEGLSEAETHEEFKANIDLLRRILNKY